MHRNCKMSLLFVIDTIGGSFMRLVCKTRNGLWKLRPRQIIKDILEVGFEYATLDIGSILEPREYELLHRNNYKRTSDKIYLTEHPEELRKEADRNITSIAKEEGLKLSIAVGPCAPADIKLGKEPEQAAAEINKIYRKLGIETALAAADAGCESVVVYPLFSGIESGHEWEINKPFYLEVAKAVKDTGSDIQILLINRIKNINGHFVRGICAEPEEACRWIDELNAELGQERFGFCFDVGTGTLCGQELFTAIEPLGSRLKAAIIRDCDGANDVSMLPYTACLKGQQTSWLGCIRGLRKTGFDGDLIMDFAETYDAFPITLKKTVLSQAFEIGKFFLWHINIENVIKKYDKRVLFGAGNMCRAYLKNYGEEYPPLFTCDNNSSRWGEDFFGITIENPEKLKELSPDTAIFICNMYYNEITEQLRKMNLPNPIEWFSDEYMPTFHMDRLEMAKDPNSGK
ncbi:hypothetical protein D6855_06795 [Butyrivibrio sp. CB08]|nr:hypothetical protein D6855_06795 [Butyrivibrio sp. CB08]